MIFNLNDTIAGIATAKFSSGVGIIRISGSYALNIAYILSKKKRIFKYKVNYSNLYNLDGSILDFGIILYFMKPKSFTGEDIIEFHTHGSIFILDILLSNVLKLGARLAEPGEFTFRSYSNNKIDLLQAEALNDLINSKDKFSNNLVLNSFLGNFSLCINNILNDIFYFRVDLEAYLEFPDEIFINKKLICLKLFKIISDFDVLFSNVYEKNLSFHFIKIAIIGNTNVGKSSLFNMLLKKNRSIISEIPGTTRDFIEDDFVLSNFSFKLIDTAGFNSSTDCAIEKIGILKTLDQIYNSEIILYVSDFNLSSNYYDKFFFDELLKKSNDKLKLFFIKNKIDLYNVSEYIKYFDSYIEIGISVKNNLGINFIFDELNKNLFNFSNNFYYLNKRNYSLFLKIKNHIDIIRKFNENDIIIDICLDNLKICSEYFYEILGKNSSDDLLKEIFSKFCLGK